MSAATDHFEKNPVDFENGQSAEILHIKQPLTASDILTALGISKAKASIVVCGSEILFKTKVKNRLIDLFGRGVAQALQQLDGETVVLDDGKNSGVSEIVGMSVADRDQKTILVGVVSGSLDKPAVGEVSNLDPNHTYFVTTEQEQQGWQSDTICQLADTATTHKKWTATLLVGGELQSTALDIALETVRRKWPLIVFEGSGPLANKIFKLKKHQQAMKKRSSRIWKWIYNMPGLNRLRRLQGTNPHLFEIISDGNIKIVRKESDAAQLRKMIEGLFTDPYKEDVLWTAWQRFAEYDLNSSRHRDKWRRLKNWPLYLGVFSTLIVLVYSATGTNLAIEGSQSSLWVNAYTGFMRWLSGIQGNQYLDFLFRFTIIILPITTSLLLAIETRLKLGSKYFLLRGAAEAIKRGIYSFRTLHNLKVEAPADKRLQYSEKDLAEHMSIISKMLLDSDVKEAAFKPYQGSIPPNMYGADAYDDGFSDLDAETYVKIRVGDQLTFYTTRTNQYERRIRRLQIWMLVWGGIGTFLAAVGAQYWLPITAAIVAAMTAYLEYQQLDQILTKYNLTKNNLENIRSNWLALPNRESPGNVQNLVREVEATLESENQGWVQYISQVQKAQQEGARPANGAPVQNEGGSG